jgi:hypothetical protein
MHPLVANFAHLGGQSCSGKEQNAIRKPSARNGEIRGLFGSPPWAGLIFSDKKSYIQSGQFGLRTAQMAHIKPMLCVFAKPFYSSGYTAPEMHHQQANAIQTTRAGAWPVWLIWYVPAALLRSRRAPKMLVGAGHWTSWLLASKQLFPCTTHTHTPVSFRSPAQHTKQGKHAKAKQK